MSEPTDSDSSTRARPYRPLKWEKAFLTALALTGNVSGAALAAQIDRSAVYDRRAAVPAFAARWADALEQAADLLEAEARRRAVDGWEEPVFGALPEKQGTGQVGTVRKYSDALLTTLLKGALPEKYRERVENRTVSTPPIDWTKVSPETQQQFLDGAITLADVYRSLPPES